MKRRQVITAFGTLAVATGTALGTGAFSAASSSSDSSLSIVTQGGDANIDINPGNENTNDGEVVVNPGSSSPEYLTDGSIVFDKLALDDLPLAVVTEPNGQGMVTIEVAVAAGQTPRFYDAIEVVNNDSQDYDIGFTFTGYGSAVTNNYMNGKDYTSIDKAVANNAFVFEEADDDNSDISPTSNDGEDPAGFMGVPGGGDRLVDLNVNANLPALTNLYGDIEDDPFYGAGGFSSDDETAKHEPLVSEVTAVANEIN
ncbi:hypothetical protein [Halobellus clavatus]|jgi:hypothetical protein|uniref:Uncharacterized protein n=1 Tax=Halobellus clavatus TaxID=660517 RepID=A0A1H3FMA0_9EURY|nr:hypothetical protein [Halobellus clavatus]SDX92071.1 hypothetical protein SAMN04487946_10452 [Halobellus clavatus]